MADDKRLPQLLTASPWPADEPLGEPPPWPTRCRHCGKPPEADGDHSCPCPHSDEDCPDHPGVRRG